jgi:putative ABC transport system ATP-binding protein
VGDLSIQDLVVEYASGADTVRPIDRLNLDVGAGSLVILMGPSGCGKTTLLSCLGGILRPTGGAIKFGDVDVTSLDARGLSTYRRETVGIVFQAFNLVPSLTATENVMVPMLAAGTSRRAAFKRAQQLLSRVGLQDRMSHRPGDLSGGQQQRVAVARAIALDPPLVLADVVELVPDFASTDRPPDTVQVSAGEVLFEQGTMGDLIYVVSDGELEIVRELASGGEELLKVATAGDYFGEIGPLFHLPRSATVRARTDAKLIGYTVRAFRERLGIGGVRDMIEHRPLEIDGKAP